jgi:hypothetical protein
MSEATKGFLSASVGGIIVAAGGLVAYVLISRRKKRSGHVALENYEVEVQNDVEL